ARPHGGAARSRIVWKVARQRPVRALQVRARRTLWFRRKWGRRKPARSGSRRSRVFVGHRTTTASPGVVRRGPQGSTGRIMELQETRMSNDTNRGGGSDLDIFEGLGKKSEKTPAAAPPPP